MSRVEEAVKLELPGTEERRFDPRDVHRLTIRGEQPQGWAHTVHLDGRQLMCSEVQLSLTATGLVKATITLPAVMLDIETNAITSLVGPFMPKEG